MNSSIENNIKGSATVIEKDAKDAPVKDIKWEVNELESEAVPMIDPGFGKKVVLRSFFFKSVPLPKEMPKPSKGLIISHYKKFIETMLWKDGLQAMEDRVPQLYFKREVPKTRALRKKMDEESADFVILVLANSRFNKIITDEAKKL